MLTVLFVQEIFQNTGFALLLTVKTKNGLFSNVKSLNGIFEIYREGHSIPA